MNDAQDFKYILISLDACIRAFAGIKTPFDFNNLPSMRNKNQIIVEEEKEEETYEERLERHKKFFQSLKTTFSNK